MRVSMSVMWRRVTLNGHDFHRSNVAQDVFHPHTVLDCFPGDTKGFRDFFVWWTPIAVVFFYTVNVSLFKCLTIRDECFEWATYFFNNPIDFQLIVFLKSALYCTYRQYL